MASPCNVPPPISTLNFPPALQVSGDHSPVLLFVRASESRLISAPVAKISLSDGKEYGSVDISIVSSYFHIPNCTITDTTVPVHKDAQRGNARTLF